MMHEHGDEEEELVRVITIVITQYTNGTCSGRSYHPGMPTKEALDVLRTVVAGYEAELAAGEVDGEG